jgi:hypothetical protein
MRMKKTIEILYYDGCPTWQKALERVRQVVAQARLEEHTEIQTVRVETDEQAQELGFLGSPTIRVDGHDVEASSQARTDFGLQCRVYQNGGRLTGIPDADLIRSALDAKET